MIWLRSWPGGRVRELDNGDLRWYIRKRLGGDVRVSIALDVETEPEAMAELALFNRDPARYQTKKKYASETLRKAGTGAAIDVDTMKEFLADAAERVRKGSLSKNYAKYVLGPYLGQWAVALGGRSLRDLTLLDLRRALKKWKTAEQKRIVVLKAFTAWLRQEDRLQRKDDPTLDLEVPPNTPEQSVRRKGYSVKQVEELYRNLPAQLARDTVLLRAKTGMHGTEIDRVARGEGVLVRVDDPSGIAGSIVFQHKKKGREHSISVDAQTFAAAERMQKRKRGISDKNLGQALDRVAIRKHGCGGVTMKRYTRTGIPVWTTRPCDECEPMHAEELRHSFASWATTVGEEVWPTNQKGVDLSKVAERMGHLGKRTTKVFYVGDTVEMMIRVPVKLEHPEDPVPVRSGARAGMSTG